MRDSAIEKNKLSDERLDALLASMGAEGTAKAEEHLTPPVINIYHLEREKERRQSDLQLKITAGAVTVSVLLTTVIMAVLLRLLSANSNQLLQIPAIAKAYFAAKYFFLIYGQEITAIVLTFFALIVLGYLLCAVLLVKNQDKLSALRKNS